MPLSARFLGLIVLLVPVLGGPGQSVLAASPSFDCGKATHEIETLICKDDELAAKDRMLTEVYEKSVAALKGIVDERQALERLHAEQRGWVKGRNDCWKAEDKRRCTADIYDRRRAELQARYGLVQAMEPVFYICENNPSNEIVATYFDTEPPSARLERGDEQVVAVQGLSGSGARYEGPAGMVFWIKGDEAMVEWPQGKSFDCKVAE